MAPKLRIRVCNSCRNAVTLLLLGLIGVQLSAATGISQLPASMPSALQIILSALGWLHLGVGLVLLVGGIQRRQVRDWAAGLDQLMIPGPFRYVRRPVYGGVLMLLFGAGLVMNTVGLLLTALLWAVAAVLYSRVDDRELMTRMGATYSRYCRRTPLLVPHLGRVIVDLFRTDS